MSIYAALGFSHTLFIFFMGVAISLLTYFASQKLYKVFLNLELQLYGWLWTDDCF